MNRKKEVCRHFQRGFCQYGDRCKYLHATQQQPKSNFAFGSGTQQQQNPNPFGFGVQSRSQSKVSSADDFGNKNHQFKPFENKWTRPSPASNRSVPSSRQPDSQPQASDHKCIDPDSCKRLIVEDFSSEKPLWKLTCYGHFRNAPCDIIGDVSYEELRAAAYVDAKCGMSLQSIVEKERNLLNSKLIEFENLVRNPYTAPQISTVGSASPISSSTLPSVQNSIPPSVSSFSQLGATVDTRQSTQPNIAFGHPNFFSTSAQLPSALGTNNVPSATADIFGSPQSNQAFGMSLGSGYSNQDQTGTQNISFSSLPVSTASPNAFDVQPSTIFHGHSLPSSAVQRATTSMTSDNSKHRETISGDRSIWLKENWIPGEIPEEAPPDAFVR